MLNFGSSRTDPASFSSSTGDDRPPPPDHLGDPERAIWRDVIAEWKGSAAALAVLVAGLEAHQRAREAREIIDNEGMTVIGRDGQPKAHP